MAVRGNRGDALPCLHDFPTRSVDKAKELLTKLPSLAPQLLVQAGIREEDWVMILRAAVESMRGTASATTADKRQFIEAVLRHGSRKGAFNSWRFIGTEGRQDYRVELSDGTPVAVEVKGCPDGNNTTIWDRPGWAREFVVWCLCPESLAHDPGRGAWSGISTRLIPKMTAERTVVDAFIFWDGRCGSRLRQCPKEYGVFGALRSEATSIQGQEGKKDWLPPPCIYLFPTSWPNVSNNRTPSMHTRRTCKFADAMLAAFEVPETERDRYLHGAYVTSRGTASGTEILVKAISRCWADGEEREVVGDWKRVRREQ